jgi:hypothetical protein
MSKEPTYVVHTGKESWWDASFTTDCGIKWPAGNHGHIKWHEKRTPCPACAAARKAKK